MKKQILITMILIFFIRINQIFSQQNPTKSFIPHEVKLDYSKEFWITSKNVKDEQYLIKVFLPRSYIKSDTSIYPVLYLVDADIFFGIAADKLYFWDFFKVKEIILVGISYGSREDCWKKRSRDFYSFTEDSGKFSTEHFLTFISDELVPKVNSDFRIDTSDQTLFGWSGGAMFALYTLFQRPELFNNYIITGIPVLYNENRWAFQMEQEYFEKRKDLPIRLYLGIGEYDEFNDSFHEFVEILKKRNYKGLQFKWEFQKDLAHEFKAVPIFFCQGMEYIYNKKTIHNVLFKLYKENGIEVAISEYHRLKSGNTDGYNLEGSLYSLSSRFAEQKKWKEAAEINKLTIQEFPNSWKAYYYLGSYYMHEGEKELAKEYLETALELNPGDKKTIERLKKVQEE